MSPDIVDARPADALVIADRYLVQEELGAGGLATVWRGWDLQLQRPVAIKMLREHLPGDSGRSRMMREARVMSTLRAPEIVEVYDCLEVHGQPCVVMELADGVDLRRWVAERGAMGTLSALAAGQRVCRALRVIHAERIIHRDVKPQNIIVGQTGVTKLIDFDLAWSPDLPDEDERGMVYGTPDYMAPEQAMGERISPETDLYALGASLYEAITGTPPFHSSSASAIMWQHVTTPPQPLRELRPDVAAPVERVIMRALAKEPRRRYSSAAEMEHALAWAAAEAARKHSDRLRRVAPRSEWRSQPQDEPDALVEAVEGATELPEPGRSRMQVVFWTLALVAVLAMMALLFVLAERMPV
jgi:serine/threonine protein kinase